jgi:hypothetical protein
MGKTFTESFRSRSGRTSRSPVAASLGDRERRKKSRTKKGALIELV